MKNKFIPFVIAIIVFIIASVAYFSPVLEGKKIFQSDIAQFRGMSKEIVEYRKENGEEPYWTNRAFGGMPAYNVSAYYPHNYIKKADLALRFLPRPADYLFLYFLGFFVLLYVLKVEWKLAILGALAFGFSTYFISLFGAGHNAKAHAIAYMPMVLAGILLVFKRKYLAGFVLTALALAFEVNASHPQMTYYLLFMILILGIVYLIDAIKQKTISHFIKSTLILAGAAILAIGVNSTSLLATKEYAAHSTRSKSELTITPEGKPKEYITTGLDREYITQYSYGITESFSLLIPRFYGGGSGENLGKDSNTYQFLKDKIGRQQAKQFSENLPTYWGEQIIIEAPFYIGAVLIFLFVLGLFLVKGNLKKWLLAATIFSLLLSWGKHFSVLTNFFIDYVPMYNKFRAVSSIQVIAELAVPLLAIIALNQFLKDKNSNANKLKYLKYALYGVGGLTLIFTLFGTSLFNFESFRDASLEQQIPGFSDAIIADRKSIFFKDSLRSLILVLLSGGFLWAYLKEKINKNAVIISFAVLILFDLVGVDKRYVNADDFVSKKQEEVPFIATDVDKEILKDKSYYRVANYTVNPINDGSTSYFHNSIGGYHAAKPRQYQELFEYQIAKNNVEVLNMLNTKYIIFQDSNGVTRLQLNEEANGNAWFVSEVEFVNSADEEIIALDSLNTKQKVIVNAEFRSQLKEAPFAKDSLASIKLTDYQPNVLKYESNTNRMQVAVFSDIYYKDGWNAYVDGELTPHFRANYVLRAMVIPEGKHEIVFKFEPTIIKKGNTITLISYALLLLIPAGWFFMEKKKKNNESPQ
ncbi:YfhO family protein [Aureibaculum sp. 2210JD6-5]|uniref:YfhO family protein n=1 Tax=Aureibaculum sp. 2210JD6-5 TaxID=3103957 RepID=UPI002AAD0EB4|nr:YfhO family protein [Aureibaculum sp. 2210JD6-5]MDY7396597.1 YfhO family protein [Aureibaculum sp. 2210JD6-5]